MTAIALATGFTIVALVASRKLTLLHPATLWLASWAAMTALFSLGALPYRSISTATLLLVIGWSALFCGGTLLGSRVRAPKWALRRIGRDRAGAPDLAHAATLAVALTLVGLAAFLLQVGSNYGWRSAIVSDATVRLAISHGATPYTIKYLYVAFAAAGLAGIAAGRATTSRARRIWVSVAIVMIATQYFSTGRSNILLAAVMASVAYFVSDPRTVSLRRVAIVAVGVGTSSLVAFVAMGSLLGKSFDISDLQTFDNTFVRHEWLAPLALPYQYVTAPLPAFDIVVEATPTGGRGACVTLRALCSVGAKLGLPVTPDPALSSYTAAPSAWNTFTALYAPLVDAGLVLGSLIVLAQGALFGLLWAGARTGSVYAVAAYATMSAAVVYSTVENTLLPPHLVGAALIAVLVTAVASRTRALVSGRGR